MPLSDNSRLILASASPRRKLLLQQLGISADVHVADIDETTMAGEAASDYVLRLSEEKAQAVAGQYPDDRVLAADTIVVLDGDLLGKPQSKEQAFSMWRRMSGQQHQVLTAVSLFYQGKIYSCISYNDVLFAAITEESMQAYWQTGEPVDKAGAYAIQGYAAVWIKEIQGSYSGIMGLPLYETAKLLSDSGFTILNPLT